MRSTDPVRRYHLPTELAMSPNLPPDLRRKLAATVREALNRAIRGGDTEPREPDRGNVRFLLADAPQAATPASGPPAGPQVTEQDLEFLDSYGAAGRSDLPADTAAAFRRVLGSLAADLAKHLETVKKRLAGRGALNWHLDQLAWMVDAAHRAVQLVDEAEVGDETSERKFAEAGTEMLAAILGRKALSIILAYENFQYEVEQFNVDLPGEGSRMIHDVFDPVLAGLRVGLPGALDAAVRELSFNWGFDFSNMVDDVVEQIEARQRFLDWLSIVLLAWDAFNIWALPVAGQPPRFGGFGGTGGVSGGAGVVSGSAVLASAESVVALRRLVAIGAISVPNVLKLLGGRPGGIAAPLKPIEASTKGGKPAVGSGGKGGPGKAEPPAARDPNARLRPGLPTDAEDAVLRRYTEGLANLREKARILRNIQAETPGPKWKERVDRARRAYDGAQRELDAIERQATGPAAGELPQHLQPLVAQRRVLQESGPVGTTVGTRVDCDAVRSAPTNLRNIEFSELDAAMRRPEIAARIRKVDVEAAPLGDGRLPTGHQRITWNFKDGSRLVADFPQEIPGRPATANEPHAELHGPKGERLDPQGIEVPERSTPAHITITGRAAAEARFAPARAKGGR